MYCRICTTFIIGLLLTVLTSCNTAKEVIEVEDQGRFKSPPDTLPTIPTNDDISLVDSIVTLTRSRLYPGEEAKITFIAKDENGVAISEGGMNVQFTFLGDGTSSGVFSATNDSGDGIYTSTLTATTFGSRNTILVIADGNTIIQSDPYQLYVVSGDYYREIDLSSATDQNEFQVEVELNTSNFDYSKVQNNGEDLRLFDEFFNEQDFWIENWNPSGTSRLWVKVQNITTDKLIMTYGNDSISSASSIEGVFSYDVNKDIYYELSQSAGPSNYVVTSYIDNNNVSITTNTGSSSQSISTAISSTYSNVINGLVSVDGPISARFSTYDDAADTIAPLSFASTVLTYPKSRGTDDWDLYNPNSTTANITLYNYDSSGSLVNSGGYTIPANSDLHIDYDVSSMGLIESDIPILGLYYHTDANDGVVMMKPSNSLIGSAAKTGSVGIVEDDTSGLIYFSNGTTQAFSGDKGDIVDFSGGDDQELALGVRVVANKGVTAVSQADGDGSDSTSFWPDGELGRDYIIPGNSQYILIVCSETVTLTLTDPGGNDDSDVCTPSGGNNPGVIPFGSSSVVTYLAGTRITGDANFYVYYEHEDEDETNVLSWKQARSYSPTNITTTVGDEQDLD